MGWSDYIPNQKGALMTKRTQRAGTVNQLIGTPVAAPALHESSENKDSEPHMDYLKIDSLYDEQALLVRQAARQFVDERVMPRIRDCFRDAEFPMDLIPEI